MTRSLLLTLALMCENVNAAPQGVDCCRSSESGLGWGAPTQVATESAVYLRRRSAVRPVTPDSNQRLAPFTLSNPMCQTGFTVAQRFDERNASGAIIKSVWVRKCTKGKIIYGGKI